MALFTVFGNPIAHSLSPQIHEAFAEQYGLLNSYRRSLSSQATFAASVAQFFRRGGAGANITLPFKQVAFDIVTHTTERARRAGAVNTLVPLGSGQLLGDTTDGLGLVRDIQLRGQQQLSGQHVLVAGAGGAARGLLQALLEADVAHITLTNRTKESAFGLINEWNHSKISYEFDLNQIQTTDIVVHSTSLVNDGYNQLIPLHALESAKIVYDLNYGSRAQPFFNWAQQHSSGQLLDGLGMLVEQAAFSFALWHDGLFPKTDCVKQQLYEQLSKQDE